MTDVTLALDAQDYLGESPFWSESDQALWWINCEHPAALHRWAPQSGTRRTWPMPSRIGGFVPKAEGGMLVVLADGLYDLDLSTGALTVRFKSTLPATIKLHECQCDRQGRLWVGAYDHDFPADRGAAGGAFYRLDGDRLTPVIDGIAVANGLAFSPDGRTIYTASTPRRTIEASDLDPDTGLLSNRRTFIALADDDAGFIDGATVDARGGYWLALVGVGEVRRYNPDGTLDRTIVMPCPHPTKPAFGGADLATVYVTSTKMAIRTTRDVVADGGVYAFEPGERGIAETALAAG